MLVIPAIDLKSGRCVRLLQGSFEQETVYGDNPAAMGKRWADAGAEWIHLVDLDGSVGQRPVNQEAILAIRKSVSVKLELGGGIRDLQTITFYIEHGIDRIILGTAAHKNPDLVKEATDRFPGQVAVGLDARGTEVMVEGWTEKTNQNLVDLARRYEKMDVAALIYTDINRDGMRTGPNIERTRELARAVNIPIIASGGVNNLEDIKNLLPLSAENVIGVITGKALYEGSLDYAEALSLVSSQEK